MKYPARALHLFQSFEQIIHIRIRVVECAGKAIVPELSVSTF